MDFSHNNNNNLNGSSQNSASIHPNGLNHNFAPAGQAMNGVMFGNNSNNGNNSNHNTSNSNGKREKSVVESVESILESLRQAVIVIEEFQAEKGQETLYRHMSDMVEEFSQLESHRSDNEILIPVEILNYIDQGKNPDLYIKDSLEACLHANERTNGKIDALQSFRNELETQMKDLYPAEYSVYHPPTTQNGEL
eukprot:TRINITY_DN897_c0_g1_i1.p1 TRINITY_DN897_c0_g1~~TRINITY_DN897_c0_g1_i1.p1  ORF type:complete len:194 (-),score=40.33 TRINITY_DN897_c0_g1_i1:82-663(-)